MADRILMNRVNTQIEMNIVCSDYSLLENINGYLCKNGIIGIRDGDGVLHYIVDGRHDRLSASRKVSTIVAEQSLPDDRNDDYYDSCAKAVFILLISFCGKSLCPVTQQVFPFIGHPSI